MHYFWIYLGAKLFKKAGFKFHEERAIEIENMAQQFPEEYRDEARKQMQDNQRREIADLLRERERLAEERKTNWDRLGSWENRIALAVYIFVFAMFCYWTYNFLTKPL